jgi:hypothetical protein
MEVLVVTKLTSKWRRIHALFLTLAVIQGCDNPLTSVAGPRTEAEQSPKQAHAFALSGSGADQIGSWQDSNISQYTTSSGPCTLGSVACGAAAVMHQHFNYIAWGTTYTVNNNVGIALTMNGVGAYQRGNGFPMPYWITCSDIGNATSCSDTEVFTHTCATERNRIVLTTVHTATVGSTVYTGFGSDADECYYNPGNGSGGGEGNSPQCHWEYLIVEVWNNQTGTWEYYGTFPVEICV